MILICAVCAQVMSAQLYSIAEHEKYTQKTLRLSTPQWQGSSMLWMNSQTSAPTPVAVRMQPVQSVYSLHAWSGETYSVGEALNATAPVKRRGFGLPDEDFQEPGKPAPVGGTPWVWLLLCAVGWSCLRRREA